MSRTVWVRWDARLVRIFNDRMEPLEVHVKQEPGRFSTKRSHIAAEKISGVERGAAWQLARVSRIGPKSACWAEGIVKVRGVEAVRVLIGLSSLAFMAHHVIIVATFFPGRFLTLAVPLSFGVAVGGAFWAWLYDRTGSLYPAWLSHLLVDAAILAVGYTMVFGM